MDTSAAELAPVAFDNWILHSGCYDITDLPDVPHPLQLLLLRCDGRERMRIEADFKSVSEEKKKKTLEGVCIFANEGGNKKGLRGKPNHFHFISLKN